MAYKTPMIVITVCFLLMVTKYFQAKEEKDECYINLDKHIKYIKDVKAVASENKNSFEKNIRLKEIAIDEEKKEKMNAQSKSRLCENQNQNLQSELRFYQLSLAIITALTKMTS